MNDRFILKIDPPQLCLASTGDDQPCPHLTAYAEAGPFSDHSRQLLVDPYCWEHLEMCIPPWNIHPTPEEIEQERFCIVNFVIGYYGGKGSALVAGPCPIERIPAPYEEATEDAYDTDEDKAFFRRYHADDQAYYVTYRDEQDQEHHVCAVWMADELHWELFPFPDQPSVSKVEHFL